MYSTHHKLPPHHYQRVILVAVRDKFSVSLVAYIDNMSGGGEYSQARARRTCRLSAARGANFTANYSQLCGHEVDARVAVAERMRPFGSEKAIASGTQMRGTKQKEKSAASASNAHRLLISSTMRELYDADKNHYLRAVIVSARDDGGQWTAG